MNKKTYGLDDSLKVTTEKSLPVEQNGSVRSGTLPARCCSTQGGPVGARQCSGFSSLNHSLDLLHTVWRINCALDRILIWYVTVFRQLNYKIVEKCNFLYSFKFHLSLTLEYVEVLNGRSRLLYSIRCDLVKWTFLKDLDPKAAIGGRPNYSSTTYRLRSRPRQCSKTTFCGKVTPSHLPLTIQSLYACSRLFLVLLARGVGLAAG